MSQRDYWYVPSTKEDERPKMALLQTDEYKTPKRAYLFRILALPFTLLYDVIVWPIYSVLLYLGLAQPI